MNFKIFAFLKGIMLKIAQMFAWKTCYNTQFFWEIGYRYELETFFKMFTRKKSRIISRFQISTVTLSVQNDLVKIEDFQDFILFIGKSHTLLYTYVKNMMLYTVFLKDWLLDMDSNIFLNCSQRKDLELYWNFKSLP